jgi:hypothetical protein
MISTGKKRIDEHTRHNGRQEQLEDSANEVMGVVGAFEYDRVNSSLLPN